MSFLWWATKRKPRMDYKGAETTRQLLRWTSVVSNPLRSFRVVGWKQGSGVDMGPRQSLAHMERVGGSALRFSAKSIFLSE